MDALRMRESQRPSLRPGTAQCQVSARDLSQLDAIHRLLTVLNDPYAGGETVAGLVDGIPVLKARCMRAATERFLGRRIESVAYALTLIGNRGLETQLFELLEELTVLKSNLESLR
jgi:hypothetical protein